MRFIHCKVLTIEEDDKLEDLGLNSEPMWVNYSFFLGDVRMFYELIENDEPVGTRVAFLNGMEVDTDIKYEDMIPLVDEMVKRDMVYVDRMN